jgi:hypothetical protein
MLRRYYQFESVTAAPTFWQRNLIQNALSVPFQAPLRLGMMMTLVPCKEGKSAPFPLNQLCKVEGAHVYEYTQGRVLCCLEDISADE